ncbi:MAG TPA: DNA-3-methyladenine glycosylase I [Thermoanaerobaculia bacterium]|nr:DNA-3-methyladenine glycosylase I [Thermoanaerobaculia bacterium]
MQRDEESNTPNTVTRCAWAGCDPLYVEYHDQEWGVPLHDDRKLFELLTLEGAQAGLAWITILRKREGYRRLFAGFDPELLARWGESEVERLLGEPDIVRHRGKIEATLGNARLVLALQQEFGSLDRYLWSFVGGEPKQNRWRTLGEVPASTAESKAMSKDLGRRGGRFVGPTICYAFMQASGMVNDHLLSCFRHGPLAGSPAQG